MWNAQMFGGVPFLGRLGSQGLYFMHLPFAFMAPNQALDLLVPLHLMVLVGGVYALVRVGLKQSAPAGFVAGAVAIGSVFVATKTLSYDQLVALAWLPWILFGTELVLRFPYRKVLVGPLALSISCLVLGGHPQYIYISFIVVLVYLVARMIESRSLASLQNIFYSVLLTVLATCLQLLATWFLGKSSGVPTHRRLSTLANSAFVVDPKSLPMALIGDPFSKFPVGITGSSEAILGIGLVAILLAILGVIGTRTPHFLLRITFAIIGLLGLACAVGPEWLPFRVFYQFVPGFGAARVPGRWLVVTLMSVCVLAAFGAVFIRDIAADSRVTFRSRKFLVPASAIGATLVLFLKFGHPRGGLIVWWGSVGFALLMTLITPRLGSRSSLAVGGFLLLLVVEIVLPLRHSPANNAQYSHSFDSVEAPLLRTIREQGGLVYAQTFDKFDNPDYLVQQLRPNTQILHGVRAIDGYDGGPWVQRRWVRTMRSITKRRVNTDLTIRSQSAFPLKARLFAQLGVRWLLVDTAVVPANILTQGWSGPVGRSGTVELWRNPEWIGSGVVYFNTSLMTSSTRQALLDLPSNSLLVEARNLQLRCAPLEAATCERVPAKVVKSGQDSGTYVTQTAREGILRTDQAWSSDWRISVDGRSQRAIPVNGNYLGVRVPAGKHTVRYWYSPTWEYPSFAISIVAFAIICLLSFRALRHFLLSRDEGFNQ
jgi:hypothetical protein